MLGNAANGLTAAVSVLVTATQVLAADTRNGRKGVVLFYDGGTAVYVIFSSADPSASLYSVKMGAISGAVTYVEVPYGYTGEIRALSASGTVTLMVTSLT